jgi:hypothetical protein
VVCRGVVEQLDVRAAAPKALSAECIKTFCRMDDEVVSMLVVDIMLSALRPFFSGLSSSSSLECPVFTPLIARTAFLSNFGGKSSHLVGWCCVGFAPVVLVLARFFIN